jgi:hypothetical protein
MIQGLHADHVDSSGAYAQKFEVVKELLEKGILKEIPEEFRDTDFVPVVTTSQTIVGEEFDMTNGHADHVDETGRYREAYEAKFGVVSTDTDTAQATAGNSWKAFLQQIIAEEKSKLKI